MPKRRKRKADNTIASAPKQRHSVGGERNEEIIQTDNPAIRPEIAPDIVSHALPDVIAAGDAADAAAPVAPAVNAGSLLQFLIDRHYCDLDAVLEDENEFKLLNGYILKHPFDSVRYFIEKEMINWVDYVEAHASRRQVLEGLNEDECRLLCASPERLYEVIELKFQRHGEEILSSRAAFAKYMHRKQSSAAIVAELNAQRKQLPSCYLFADTVRRPPLMAEVRAAQQTAVAPEEAASVPTKGAV